MSPNTNSNYVSGVITENTVWTRSNSPYIVSGHIGVDAGVKLRIRLEYSEDGEVWKVCSVFGDTVIVSSRYSGFITWLSRVNLTRGFHKFRGEYIDDELIAEGYTEHVFLDAKTYKPVHQIHYLLNL